MMAFLRDAPRTGGFLDEGGLASFCSLGAGRLEAFFAGLDLVLLVLAGESADCCCLSRESKCRLRLTGLSSVASEVRFCKHAAKDPGQVKRLYGHHRLEQHCTRQTGQ